MSDARIESKWLAVLPVDRETPGRWRFCVVHETDPVAHFCPEAKLVHRFE